MQPASTESSFTCATCEAPLLRAPVFHVGLPFCCAGCVADGPCTCSYDEEIDDARFGEIQPVAIGVADDDRGLVGARG